MGRPAVVSAVFPVFVRAYMQPKTPADKALVRRVVDRTKTATGAKIAATLWKSFADPEHDLRERASGITAPVLITWGAKDPSAPVRWGRKVAEAIPGSVFETFPTGHVVFSSEPRAWLHTVLPFVAAAHGVGPKVTRRR
jgi:pimeloyl-ACP methyl ester carboxylesterase